MSYAQEYYIERHTNRDQKVAPIEERDIQSTNIL